MAPYDVILPSRSGTRPCVRFTRLAFYSFARQGSGSRLFIAPCSLFLLHLFMFRVSQLILWSDPPIVTFSFLFFFSSPLVSLDPTILPPYSSVNLSTYIFFIYSLSALCSFNSLVVIPSLGHLSNCCGARTSCCSDLAVLPFHQRQPGADLS